MPNKLTDNEIVKAFRECCVKPNGNFCDECSYNKGMCNDIQMATDILDLINRLQAENEELLGKIEELEANRIELLENIEQLEDMVTQNEGVLPKYENYIKAEAYKEFAERLEKELGELFMAKHNVVGKVIDNLLKELVGEENAMS